MSESKPLTQVFDVVVIGGTPGGISAAIAAARSGCRVAITEHHAHLGGMATSGLGKSDIENREMIGGIFAEFVAHVRSHYAERFGEDSHDFSLCREGYYYEPSVAEAIFDRMLENEGECVCVLRSHVLQSVEVINGRVRRVHVMSSETASQLRLEACVFIDASYEGDLYGLAGAEFRLGRESRDEFDEPHAGLVYYDYEEGVFLAGTTGEGDGRLPAYTYRFCLTTDPDNGYVLQQPPEDYDRQLYLPYHDDLAAGRLSAPRQLMSGWGYYPEHFDTLLRALSVTELPNQKIDANINPRPLAFPFAEQNVGYVEETEEKRERIRRRHRNIALGLLYFLQNDRSVPEKQREMARRYNLPLDEFTDNDHFPYQLYVREARRLKGQYTLTEHDIARISDDPTAGMHEDAIAVGEFPIDSFPTQLRKPTDTRVLEGYLGMLNKITRPYQIPYRIMLPERVRGLIVPVAASTTHVAYSSIRMEPTWMAMGQAAGVAASLAVKGNCECDAISIDDLQQTLHGQGQILEPRLATATSTNSTKAEGSV
ncbi:FAD-dependent oxidoreductase [Novipirellula sp. SH528]|uniref:FAD-dependent oxidoreductase n=1 Tax=Novipirellula sp. SH528 TaxID=3454466 RepID=UPI003F9F7B24